MYDGSCQRIIIIHESIHTQNHNFWNFYGIRFRLSQIRNGQNIFSYYFRSEIGSAAKFSQNFQNSFSPPNKNLDNFGFRLISTRNSFVITSGISESRVVLEDLDLSQDSNTEKSLLKIFNFCERLKYFHTFLSLTRKTSIKNWLKINSSFTICHLQLNLI